MPSIPDRAEAGLFRLCVLLSTAGRRVVDAARAWLCGPLKTALFGRRPMSLVAVLSGLLLAVASAAFVQTTVGTAVLAERVVETWTGESPHPPLFIAAGGLLAVGAVAAALGAGLLPTLALVGGPLFGAGVTTYGTQYAVLGQTQVVSLPQAVGDGLGVAVWFGLPIAVAAFVVGRLLRRVVDALLGGAGGAGTAGHAQRD